MCEYFDIDSLVRKQMLPMPRLGYARSSCKNERASIRHLSFEDHRWVSFAFRESM
jgi:hypothetical protein